MTNYKWHGIVDGRPRQVIVDEDGKTINNNPTKKELKCLDKFPEGYGNDKLKYTDKQLLNSLRVFENENGRVPKTTDFVNNPRYPGPSVYRVRFGSWNRAIEMAGLSVNFFAEVMDEELLGCLLHFYDENGRVPIAADFDCNPRYPNLNTYIRHFGSWSVAIEIAGLYDKRKIRKPKLYADDELLGFLKEFYQETGKAPSIGDFNLNPEYPNYGTYVNRFGSWSNALKLVELDVDKMIGKGILETSNQKARFSEMIVIDRFKNGITDLSGKNQNSPYDGICPNGKTYDVKSSKLISFNGVLYWSFGTNNKYKEEIEIYYFIAFNSDWTKLEHVWRVPGEIVEKDYFRIGLNPGFEFTIEDMEEYEITSKFRMYVKEDNII